MASIITFATPPRLLKPVRYGFLASALLVSLYLTVLTLLSGWSYAQAQFLQFGYYIVGLSAGFGIQVGMYAYLKKAVSEMHGSSILGVTGATSTVSMLSCCTHYLINLLPLLGTAGLVTLLAQYQIEFFWVGIAFNLGGIIYIGNKITSLK
jgi:Cu+-exporting ATPase